MGQLLSRASPDRRDTAEFTEAQLAANGCVVGGVRKYPAIKEICSKDDEQMGTQGTGMS
jgi:hypothetical protein